jgi:hypothetical protein
MKFNFDVQYSAFDVGYYTLDSVVRVIVNHQPPKNKYRFPCNEIVSMRVYWYKS